MADAGLRADLAEAVDQPVAGAKDRHHTRVGRAHLAGRHPLQRRVDFDSFGAKRGEGGVGQKPGQFMQRLPESMGRRAAIPKDGKLVVDERMVHDRQAGFRCHCHRSISLQASGSTLPPAACFCHSQNAGPAAV